MLNHPHSAVEKLLKLIREQREKLYYLTQHRYAHERVWEDEEEEQYREARNKLAKKTWDEETEELLDNCFRSE